MVDRHAPALRALLDAVGGTKGALDAKQRQSLLDGKGILGPMRSLANKVATNPRSVTDESIRELIAAGASEDEIFECVIAAALGAGMERLRKGLALLEEKKP
jgi:hypothetical protein